MFDVTAMKLFGTTYLLQCYGAKTLLDFHTYHMYTSGVFKAKSFRSYAHKIQRDFLLVVVGLRAKSEHILVSRMR